MIRCTDLGKRYRLSQRGSSNRASYTRLSDTLVRWVKRPFGRAAAVTESEEFDALRDVNFEIREGEVVGVIGRNGAGKSTLLKLLSRITEPTTGRIELAGRIASLLEVGTGFHPELSGRENIFLNGTILGMTRQEIRRKFDEIVAFAEVGRFVDTPVKHYSSGMYVRLAFAVAAHLEPEILLVDEVLAVGDVEFQKKCLGKMQDVSRGGRTVLFVSHQMGAIAQLCTRCLYLRQGRLVDDGPTAKTLRRYLSDGASNAIGFSDRVVDAARVWISAARTIDQAGNPAWEIPHDDGIHLDLTLATDGSPPPANLCCTIAVQDRLNRRVFSSYHAVLPPQWSSTQVNVRVALPRGFLAPGGYSFITTLNTLQGEVFDRLSEACSFEVMDAGTPFSMFEPGSYGCVLADCRWSIDSQQEVRVGSESC